MRIILLALVLAACGGGDDPEPLIAGSLTASYAGTTFTPKNGFATAYKTSYVLIVGDGAIHCGSESANDPPPGHTVAFSLDALDVGSYSAFTQFYTNVDEFEGVGSNGGSVTISASSDASVAGDVSFAYTATDGRMFSVAGSFEVVHCP